MYLVRWKGKDEINDEWVKETDFNDQAPIRRYWKEKEEFQKVIEVIRFFSKE